jgi:hypothetical protein
MTLYEKLKKLRDECTPGKWVIHPPLPNDYITINDTDGYEILASTYEGHYADANAELIALQHNHLDDVIALVGAAQANLRCEGILVNPCKGVSACPQCHVLRRLEPFTKK